VNLQVLQLRWLIMLRQNSEYQLVMLQLFVVKLFLQIHLTLWGCF